MLYCVYNASKEAVMFKPRLTLTVYSHTLDNNINVDFTINQLDQVVQQLSSLHQDGFDAVIHIQQ